MEEIEEKTRNKLAKPFKSNLPERLRTEGGPGRPLGLKNKATLLRETLLDVFNNSPDRQEALERTLFEIKDGKKYVNPETLRIIVSILPKDQEFDEGSTTINFNLALTQFGKLSIDDLKSIATLARTEVNTVETSAESSSDT